jgi:ATP-dependent Lhr-like helicase
MKRAVASGVPELEPHELLERWFSEAGFTPFEFQREVWRAAARGESGLLHSPTGSGKTLAVWGAALLTGLQEVASVAAGRPARSKSLRVLWITPLRALASDTAEALRRPLATLPLEWRVETRTADTPTAVKARQRRTLPEVLVTTPESLSLLLSWKEWRRHFADLSFVVVDEWHELLASKRGVQTELGLARLRRLRSAQQPNPLPIWGLSATLANLDQALDALLGDPTIPRRLVRGTMPKAIAVDALVPESMERFPWSGHLAPRLVEAAAQEIAGLGDGRSTLLFTNTRSQAELWFQALLDARPDWAGELGLHHGSLDRATRDGVEKLLRLGKLRCVVATSSLDLGVDFTPVDRVLQVGSPKGVARLIQRAGRSGHQPGRESRLTCVPTNALELLEVAAARRALERGSIEPREPLRRALDVLAQHLVTAGLGGGFAEDEMLAEVRSTHAFRDLTEAEWQWTLSFVTSGGPALAAYPDFHRAARDGAGRIEVAEGRLAARHRMAIGTIASDASADVRYLSGRRLGSVEESFVARLTPGDRFYFGGKVVEFVRLEGMSALVRRSRGAARTVPRWMGGRMPLSSELARALRERLEQARRGIFEGPEMVAVRQVLETQQAWSALPATDEILVERWRSPEGWHLFLYPFEGRLVHEGLAALWAYRLARLQPMTFTYSMNDYGVDLLSVDEPPLDEALRRGLLSPDDLAEDLPASLNAAELAKRQFREIARVAGLVFPGYPGQARSTKQLQVSTGLLFDVFARYDPANLLLEQARREVFERQLEHTRLRRALERLATSRVLLVDVPRPTPFAFPLLADIAREQLSSEGLAERVRAMRLELEEALAS